MANSQVISQIRRKSSGGGYETFYLGPELHYIGALSSSNNNNLEEQLLMGVDRVIKSWHDDTSNVDRKIIEFRRAEDSNDFYFLEVYKYNGGSDTDIYIVDTVLYFDASANMSVVDTTLMQGEHDDKINYDETINSLIIAPIEVTEQDILKYKKSDDSVVTISSKTVTQSYESGVVITKEEITNYL